MGLNIRPVSGRIANGSRLIVNGQPTTGIKVFTQTFSQKKSTTNPEKTTIKPTTTPTITLKNTSTPTPSITPTFTPTPSITPSITPTNTSTPTFTPTQSQTNTPTLTPTNTITPTVTPTQTTIYLFAQAIDCVNGSVEVIYIPSVYQNLNIYYVVRATNGNCYVVTGPTNGPATIVWNGLIYGTQADCSTCP